MDTQRFLEACRLAQLRAAGAGGIGTLGERSLHAALKFYFEESTDRHEVKVGSFVADIVGENGIMEIQTRSLDKLRKKLTAFLEVCPVTVVYPVAQVKWVCWTDPESGEQRSRRRSPKRGELHSAFAELYKIKAFLSHPDFRLCIVLLELEELRVLNGWSKDKKRGGEHCDRIPLALLDEVWFQCPADYLRLFPASLPEQFTTADYQREAKTSMREAQLVLHICHALGAAERVGKSGNFFLYQIQHTNKL